MLKFVLLNADFVFPGNEKARFSRLAVRELRKLVEKVSWACFPLGWVILLNSVQLERFTLVRKPMDDDLDFQGCGYHPIVRRVEQCQHHLLGAPVSPLPR